MVSSSKKDLELLFQLIHLRFTQPRADADGFQCASYAIEDAAGQPERRAGIQFRERTTGRKIPKPSASTSADTGNNQPVESRKSMAFYRDTFCGCQ